MKKIKTKVGNATIIHSKENKDINKIVKVILKSENRNFELYGRKMTPYTILICDSLQEYKTDINYNGKGEPFHQGTFKFGKIIIVTPSALTKVKANYVGYILYHELNHKMYEQITKGHKPVWLMEGMTMLNQNDYVPQAAWEDYFKSISNIKKYLPVNPFHLNAAEERDKMYVLSYFCLKHLEKKMGRRRLINFLSRIPSPYNDKKFWEIFEERFKLNKNQLIQEAVK